MALIEASLRIVEEVPGIAKLLPCCHFSGVYQTIIHVMHCSPFSFYRVWLHLEYAPVPSLLLT